MQEQEKEEVIRRYADMVYRLALARTGNRSDADDVFQEVFLRYVQKAPDFTEEEHRKAWLLKVTVNCSVKLLTSFWKKRVGLFSERQGLEAYSCFSAFPFRLWRHGARSFTGRFWRRLRG